jgi:hypothetical protein
MKNHLNLWLVSWWITIFTKLSNFIKVFDIFVIFLNIEERENNIIRKNLFAKINDI